MFYNTHGKFCIALVTGTPGSGKSFCCSRDVYNVLCQSDRCIVTNLPINVPVMAQWVAAVRKDLNEQDVIDRITILEPERLQRWKQEIGGPWELAAEGLPRGIEGRDGNLMGADFILDECHLYCPSTGDGTHESVRVMRKNWKDWLGEIRHEGWRRVLFVSQDDEKIGKPIQIHSELRYELTNGATDRVPYFQIPFGDFYSLVASFTGVYYPVVVVTEFRRVNARSVFVHAERVRLAPKYFALYESYAHAGGGAHAGAIDRPKLEWEVRPTWWWGVVDGVRKAPTWAWFYGKYRIRVTMVLAFAGVLFWMCFLGGLGVVFSGGMSAVTRVTMGAMGGKKAAVVAKDAGITPQSAPSPVASPVPLEAPEDSGEFAKALVSTMAGLSPEQRQPIERALREAGTRIRMQGEAVKRLEEKQAQLESAAAEAAEAVVEQLPKVTGFVGNDKAFINGRTMKVGDVILFNDGKSRVRIRRIDRAERVVYLEDARVIRFPVRDADIRVPDLASPVSAPPNNLGSEPPQALQPVGSGTTPSVPSRARPGEKSIVVPRSDAATGVLPLDQ